MRAEGDRCAAGHEGRAVDDSEGKSDGEVNCELEGENLAPNTILNDGLVRLPPLGPYFAMSVKCCSTSVEESEWIVTTAYDRLHSNAEAIQYLKKYKHGLWLPEYTKLN